MNWNNIKLGDLFEQYRIEHQVQDSIEYGQITISKNGYIKFRTKKMGNTIGRKRQFVIDLKQYPNTMLFTRQGVAEGAIGFAPIEVDGCIATENMPMFSLKPNISKKFVELLFKSQQYIEKINKIIPTGSAQKSIHERDLLQIELTIPDEKGQLLLIEQFNKIEDDMSILDNEIENQQNLLTKLKQSILQEAIEGKLTSKWREQNQDIESASILLEKIQLEKEQLIKDKKIRKSKILSEIKEEEIPFYIPNNWEWCRLGNIMNLVTDGAHHTPTYTKSGVHFLSVKDVAHGTIDLSNTKYISEKEHQELSKRCNPEFGDLLLTKVGTTGIAKVIDIDKEFSLFVSVALLKFNQNYLYNNYLENLINSPFVKKQSASGTKGMGNKNLVIRTINDFIIPIPPIDEQKEIVNKIEKLFFICDELEEQINSSKQNTQTLMQAVLKEAFEN